MFSTYLESVRRAMVQEAVPLEHLISKLDIPETHHSRLFRAISRQGCSGVMPNLTAQGRRINNFCLGSDPEFVFYSSGREHKHSASALGLRAGLAVGCDQNQRLGELRGWPTRSVVEHVAGILSTFRTMFRVYPSTRETLWRSGAWYDNDGIGGHVHFGRKRPDRDKEVVALDVMARVFNELSLFPRGEWDRRRKGDSRGQQYGTYGDIRPQLHGYEYRTLPSWLCSPLKAFIVLTLSKLAVLDPELVSSWVGSDGVFTSSAPTRLFELVKYYSSRDDDAAILRYLMVDGSLPEVPALTLDFKTTWGFTGREDPKSSPCGIVPAVIKPHAEEVEEIQAHLLNRTPLGYKDLPATFRETIPSGYNWYYNTSTEGSQYSGVGDLIHDLVTNNNHAIYIRSGTTFGISADLVNPTLLAGVRKLYPGFSNVLQGAQRRSIYITREMTNLANLRQTKHLILGSGLFPIWTVNSVQADSMKVWAKAQFDSAKPVKSRKL